MRHTPALAATLCSLLLLGCPDSTPTPPNGSSAHATPDADGSGGGTQDGTVTDSSNGSAPHPTWQLIDEETDKELAWPLFTPVMTWPAPTALLDLASEEERGEVAPRAKILRELAEALLNPNLLPSDFDAALKRDAEGRLHLTVGRGRPQGSATTESHGSDFPPVFTLVLEKPGPRATNVAALREAVAQVVRPDLAKELAQKDNMLEPHPKVPGAANAFLDRSGFGMQFPYLYAWSSEGQLLLVFQEVPHGKAPR